MEDNLNGRQPQWKITSMEDTNIIMSNMTRFECPNMTRFECLKYD